MKRLIFAIIAAFLITAPCSATETGTNFREYKSGKHKLSELWQEYDKARKADLPKDQLAILKTIREQALKRKLAPDFYDASWLSIRVQTAISWKERTAAQKEFIKDVKEFGDSKPRYPWDAFVDYETTAKAAGELEWGYKADKLDKAAALWEDYRARYAGKAAELIGWQEVLRLKMRKSRQEAEFLALRDECKDFEKRRAYYCKKAKGSDYEVAGACTYGRKLLGILEGKALWVEFDGERILVRLTNMPSCKLKITAGEKTLWQTNVEGSRHLFFVPDSVWVNLPEMDDGDYKITGTHSEIENSCSYSRKSLSIAERSGSRGSCIFVADYNTGEPIQKCDLTMFGDSNKVITQVKDFIMEGFTPLPDSVVSVIDKAGGYCKVIASKGAPPKKMSRGLHIRGSIRPEVHTGRSGYSCDIFTDRGAFNPGDTVRFKMVAWSRDKMKAAPKGTEFTAVLQGSGKGDQSRVKLVTNEFGSAEGEFPLERTQRGGDRAICIEKDGREMAWEYITVDDFVLPTFTVEWYPDTILHVTGDTLEFRGKVIAYSGHSLSSATARYNLSSFHGMQRSGPLPMDSEGNFIIRLPSERNDNFFKYSLTVTVSDATGETLSFTDKATIFACPEVKCSPIGYANGCLVPPASLWRDKVIVSGDEALFKMSFNGKVTKADGLTIRWTFSHDGEILHCGELGGSGIIRVPVRGLPAGVYAFKVEMEMKRNDGLRHKGEHKYTVLKIADDDTVLVDDITAVIKEEENDPLALQVGATGGRAWFVMEIFDDKGRLLDSRTVTIAGEKGKAGSLETVRFHRKEGWPEKFVIKAFTFRDGKKIMWKRTSYDESDSYKIPLSFTRFTDKAQPDSECTLEISSSPSVECAAAVFDQSVETVRKCKWNPIYRESYSPVGYDVSCGITKASWNNGTVSTEEEDEAIPFQLAGRDRHEAAVREYFANTIAWEPFLRPDKDGRIKFSFRTSDKLSTYVVQLFAHDRDMNSAVLRRQMQVTLPVKIAVVEPGYLYEGDRYTVHATLSNSSASEVSGTMTAEFFKGGSYKSGRPVHTEDSEVTVAAGKSLGCAFKMPAASGCDTLGVLLSFTADSGNCADAVFVKIPVKKAVQTITEAHSALLKTGESRRALEAQLRSKFVNVPGSEAYDTLVCIRQMLLDAVPQGVRPKSDNVLAQLDAVYSNILARKLGAYKAADAGGSDAEIVLMEKKIAACRNADGGYAWFEGMNSSPAVTAAVLEHLHNMAQAGYQIPPQMQTTSAAQYLDKAFFTERARPSWCGGIGKQQYLHVRSLFPVAFKAPDISTKTWRSHKKAIRNYLVPSTSRGLNAQILSKARRLSTLRALLASEEGIALAMAWGIPLKGKMNESVAADVETLLQYSEDHWSGGCYYPNAVMPFKGLMDSELYAHTLLACLLEECGHSDVADGIRLWMMIQKESQHWETDPAYLEALGCVLNGSEKMLGTNILALKAICGKSFDAIAASGNDLSVSRRWFVRHFEDSDDSTGIAARYVELKDGDILRIGDRVRAEYRIWNRENRSFVKLSAPRHAALRPVNQLSGNIGWGLKPIRVNGWYETRPQGYRSVLIDRSEYWFDSFPEENTTLSEEFFVTQEGVFQSPVVTIESLYAPHYRANSASDFPMTTAR